MKMSATLHMANENCQCFISSLHIEELVITQMSMVTPHLTNTSPEKMHTRLSRHDKENKLGTIRFHMAALSGSGQLKNIQ